MFQTTKVTKGIG